MNLVEKSQIKKDSGHSDNLCFILFFSVVCMVSALYMNHAHYMQIMDAIACKTEKLEREVAGLRFGKSDARDEYSPLLTGPGKRSTNELFNSV